MLDVVGQLPVQKPARVVSRDLEHAVASQWSDGERLDRLSLLVHRRMKF